MNKKLSNLLLGVVVVVVLYIVVSGIRYRFTNPEMTETQCVLNIVDVVTWK